MNLLWDSERLKINELGDGKPIWKNGNSISNEFTKRDLNNVLFQSENVENDPIHHSIAWIWLSSYWKIVYIEFSIHYLNHSEYFVKVTINSKERIYNFFIFSYYSSFQTSDKIEFFQFFLRYCLPNFFLFYCLLYIQESLWVNSIQTCISTPYTCFYSATLLHLKFISFSFSIFSTINHNLNL
jgi:hypothetical protein